MYEKHAKHVNLIFKEADTMDQSLDLSNPISPQTLTHDFVLGLIDQKLYHNYNFNSIFAYCKFQVFTCVKVMDFGDSVSIVIRGLWGGWPEVVPHQPQVVVIPDLNMSKRKDY